MTEPIEKWKEEARNYIESLPSSMDEWRASDVEKAYIAAKRSTPVVEVDKYDHIHYAPIRNLCAQMDNKGIQYRIKGE